MIKLKKIIKCCPKSHFCKSCVVSRHLKGAANRLCDTVAGASFGPLMHSDASIMAILSAVRNTSTDLILPLNYYPKLHLLTGSKSGYSVVVSKAANSDKFLRGAQYPARSGFRSFRRNRAAVSSLRVARRRGNLKTETAGFLFGGLYR